MPSLLLTDEALHWDLKFLSKYPANSIKVYSPELTKIAKLKHLKKSSWFLFYFSFRQLFSGWFWAYIKEKSLSLHHNLLPSLWNVCYCVLDKFSSATRNCAWKDDTSCDCFPCACQYLQYNYDQYPKGWRINR